MTEEKVLPIYARSRQGDYFHAILRVLWFIGAVAAVLLVAWTIWDLIQADSGEPVGPPGAEPFVPDLVGWVFTVLAAELIRRYLVPRWHASRRAWLESH